jgi:hypothetical protein
MAAAAQNYRAYVESVSPPWASGENSAGYYGAAIGLTGDLIAEALRLCLLMPWLLEAESPDDVLALVGSEVRMPRYQNETAAAYRARLVDYVNRYANAGTPARINAEIAAAGLNGTVTFQPGHPGPPPALATPYWSQFWITTTHTDDATLSLLRAIVMKWKSVYWLFRGFILTGFTSQLFAIGEAAVGEDPVGG